MERRWLEEQLAAGHSLKRIGRLAGKNQSTVSYWLRKYGLRAVHWERCAPKGAVPEDALRELIAAGLPIARVAQALGVSTSRIQYWLRRYGMQTKRGERIAANRQARTGASTELQLLCGRHGAVPFRMDTAGRYRCVRCSSEAVARRRRRVKEILVRNTGGKCGSAGMTGIRALCTSTMSSAVRSPSPSVTTETLGRSQRSALRSGNASFSAATVTRRSKPA